MTTATNGVLELRDFTGATMDVKPFERVVDIEICGHDTSGNIIDDAVYLVSAEDAIHLIDLLSKWLEARHGILGNTERLLALYGNEIGVPMTLEQLINSHRSQREMISRFSGDMREMRRKEMQEAYAGYDLARISALREVINDLLDGYIDEVTQAKKGEAKNAN